MKNIYKKLLLPLAILIALIPLANPLNIFNDLRLFAFDTLQQISPRDKLEDDPVVIIDIDDQSLNNLGQWPWSRDLLSRLVTNTEQALTTSFDIVFAERDRTGSDVLSEQYSANSDLIKELKKIKPNDRVFAESMESHSTVVLGSAPNNKLITEDISPKYGLIIQGDSPKEFLPKYTGMQNNLPTLIDSSAGVGSMSIGGNSSIVRSLPTFEVVNGQIVPSLMLETLRVAIGASTYQIKSSNASGELAFGESTGINNVKLGNVIIPTNSNGYLWLHSTFKKNLNIIPAFEVINNAYDKEFFAGKIVLVGTSASGLLDIRNTSLENDIPGVTIIAQGIQQIINGDFLVRPDWMEGAEFLFGLLFSILICLIIQYFGPIGGLITFLVANLSSLYGSFYGFNELDYLIDPISPLIICLTSYLIITFFNFLFTELERSKVRTAFSQYLAPEMVSRLAESSESLKLGGEKKNMTFLFSDIRGFTAISESYKSNPEELTELINNLLTVLSNEILDNAGTIDKYMGDCIMAFWNAPTDQDNHTDLALKASFDMEKALKEFNIEFEKQKGMELKIGIGINTGECIVGNMGSEKRFDYTVLGDPVNLASRLEGQSGTYGFQRILGQETVNGLKSNTILFELDLIQVKGKNEPVKIYTSFDKFSLKDGKLSEFSKDHEEFLNNYRNQKWDIAINFIEKWEQQVTEFDLYYAIFKDRIKDMKLNLADPNWNGAYVATTK
jgi:adenylate cyclase